MSTQWIRKDFSKESKIKQTLLEKLRNYSKIKTMELPEQYEDEIAAAGISQGEQDALEKWKEENGLHGNRFH